MADYVGINSSEGTFKDNRARRVISSSAPSSDASDDRKELPIELTRVNHVYAIRGEQLETNILSVKGGRDYVARRLSRFSGESNIDWQGGRRADGGQVQGRKQQSHCFPYAGRIVDKISQHVFSTAPKRENCPPEIEEDASATGLPINELMRQANDYITSCGWCWIGVDAPTIDGQISQLKKTQNKIRPYIQVYSPIEVVDWKFNSIGDLDWLITESYVCESSTPDQPEVEYLTRRIWTTGAVKTVKLSKDKDGKYQIVSTEDVPISYQGVPFIPVGRISSDGHPFDDVESVNRSIMDLESVNRANFFKRCYPQLVLPVGCIQNVSDAYGAEGTGAAELIVGLNYPILISKDDPLPFYLTPSAADMSALRSEIESLKRNMFESVGLMLQSESRQVASAESKAWDFLDVAMVMKARAKILEDAENKVAEIVNEWDASIPAWTASYNTQFDIGDFATELNALIMAVNVPMPDEMTRVILSKIADRLDRVGSGLTDEQKEAIEAALVNYKASASMVGALSDIDTNSEDDEPDEETETNLQGNT